MLESLNDNVILIVEEPKETMTGSKLLIPEAARKENNVGVVVDPPEVVLPNGKTLKKGDRVLFRTQMAIKAQYEEKEYLVVPFAGLLARLL